MKTTTYNKAALVMVATLGVAFLAAGAHAGEAVDGGATRTVHYQDLNLNSAEGAKVLYQRIRTAAAHVCGDVGSRQMDVAAAAQKCMDQAIVSSVRAVNNAQLTRTANMHGYEVRTDLTVASVK